MCTSTDEVRASDDESTFPRMIGQQGFTHRNGHHCSEVVVVFEKPIGMFDVRLNVKKKIGGLSTMKSFRIKGGLARQSTRSVIDGVQWGKIILTWPSLIGSRRKLGC